MRKSYPAWVVVMILLVVGPNVPVMAAETGTGFSALAGHQAQDAEILLVEIQEVERHLHHLLDLARMASAEGTFDAGAVSRRAELLVDEAAELERKVARLEDSGRLGLDAKLAAVQLCAADLQKVVNGGVVLRSPDHTRSDGPLVVDRELRSGGSTRSVANDDCTNAYVIGIGSYAGDTSDASNDGEARCGSSLDSPDVWFRYVATESAWVVADTFGSDFDTVLSVHDGCPGTINNQIICNDDSSGLQSAVRFHASAGNEYLIRVSGVNGSTGPYELRVARLGEMRGNVRSATDQQPITSARVTAYDEQGLSVTSAYTDSSGDWVIGNLAAGAYFLETSANAYQKELWDDIPCLWGCDATDGDLVTVTTGETTQGIDFDLDQLGRLTGTVRDGISLEWISGAYVRLWLMDGTNITYSYTNSSGFYSISGLLAGMYYLTVENSLYQAELFDDLPCPGGPPTGCNLTSGTPVTIQVNATTGGVDFSLLPKGRITGTVRDHSNGSPLGSCQVKVWTAAGSYLKAVYTASDGIFFAGGLDSGAYFLSAHTSNYQDQLFDGVNCDSTGCAVTSGTPIIVPDGGIAEGVDFEIEPLGRIQGMVTDNQTGEPILSVQVRIYSESGSQVDSAYTKAAGLFQSDGLPSGNYFASARDGDYMSQVFDGLDCGTGCVPTTGTSIPVANAQVTTGIDFVMMPLSRISGTVTRDGTGEPLSGVLLRIFDGNGSDRGWVYSQVSGEYTFSRLTHDVYYVKAVDADALDEVFDDLQCPTDCDVTAGMAIEVTPPAAVGGIDFALRMLGTIEGDVVASDQRALSCYVQAVDASGHIAVTYSVFTSDSAPAHYILRRLLGDYRVAIDCTSNHRDEVYDDYVCPGEFPSLCNALNGTPLTVAPDEAVEGIDFIVDPLGSIAGRVTAADTGAPLNSRTVRALSPSGAVYSSDATDSDGRYELTNLYPDTYYVMAEDSYFMSIGYVDEVYNDIPCPGGPGEGCDVSSGTPFVVAGPPGV